MFNKGGKHKINVKLNDIQNGYLSSEKEMNEDKYDEPLNPDVEIFIKIKDLGRFTNITSEADAHKAREYFNRKEQEKQNENKHS